MTREYQVDLESLKSFATQALDGRQRDFPPTWSFALEIAKTERLEALVEVMSEIAQTLGLFYSDGLLIGK